MNTQNNEKRLDDLLHRVIGQETLEFDSDAWKRKYPQQVQELQAMKQAPHRSVRGRSPQIGRFIMKHRLIKYVAIAAIVMIMAGVLEYWPSGGMNSRVYGMMDIPRLLREANTVSIHGWVGNPGMGKVELEYQCDMQTGRFYAKKPAFDSQAGAYSNIVVCDGEYLMRTRYVKPTDGEPFQEVRYQKVSPFYGRVETQKVFRTMFMVFGNLDQVEGARKTGEEQLDGILYDVWEGTIGGESHSGRTLVIKSWLCGADGRIGRIELWQGKDGESLERMVEIDRIRLNLSLSSQSFSTEPLTGYTLGNTKETASFAEFNSLEEGDETGSYQIHISFTLADGSVLVCWSSEDKTSSDPSGLFATLEIGGPLPKLSKQLAALKAWSPQKTLDYPGHHLAYTRKGGSYYEWSLYVPAGESPDRSSFMGYQICTTVTDEPRKRKGDSTSMFGDDLPIQGQTDFQRWVLPAMAELSETGQAPEYVTYDFVMNLAKELGGRQ